MKKLLFLLIISSCFLMCKKGIEVERLYIRGRVFLVDTLTQTSNGTPIGHRVVTLGRQGTNTLNYIYSDSTDANGYFMFPILSDDKSSSFAVRFEDSIKGYFYKGSTVAKAGEDAVVVKVYLDPAKQNGLILKFIDDRDQPLPKVNIRLYGNPTLSQLNDSTGSGAVQSFSSNEYGIAYKFNLPAGTYYVNAEEKTDSITYERIMKAVKLNSTGLISDTVVMRRKQPLVINQLIVLVTDSTGGAVPKARVNMYTSPFLADINDPAGAIDSLLTDVNGVVKKSNVPAGDYYLSASKLLDTTRYIRHNKFIRVAAIGPTSDSMVIRKSK